jgi:5-methylcytosine-specific restriction endonuclease McrA
LGAVLVIGAGVCLAAAVASLLGPQYNDEPLTRGTRKFIRERDGETCFYCWVYAPNGHVDHRISRARGGSNDPDNLAWACAPCNWSKGTMSDTEFLSLFD